MSLTKFYPPYIEGKLPAQVGDTLRIPYQLNRSQGIRDVQGAILKARIKTISTDRIITENGDLETEFVDNKNKNEIFTAIFQLNNVKLEPGQFYKIQLAFGEGYYSTIGVFKYMNQPQVYIENLIVNGINFNVHNFKGKFIPGENDNIEKVYSYSFNIYKNGKLYYTTKEIIHNNDDEFDSYINNQNFEQDEVYQIEYCVTTINNLKISSPKYRIASKDIQIDGLNVIPSIKLEMDNNDGFIKVIMYSDNKNKDFKGNYCLFRADSKSQYKEWNNVAQITIDGQMPKNEIELFKDFAIEQGVSYKYLLKQFSETLITSGKESNEVVSDYEDLFLYDGERQLKIKFDPKISSFKTTILDSKQDTLGGKYPFFFRGGDVEYKEMQISGLISFNMDENNCFNKDDNTYDTENRTGTPSQSAEINNNLTDLTSGNITREREFKLEVLNWLNDGKPKLFKSPTEGIYLVRLMNVSLSPNDTLGRMIHSFNATAYEMEKFSYENLLNYNMIGKNHEYHGNASIFKIFNFSNENKEISINEASFARIIEAKQNDKFRLWFKNISDPIDIIIGSTGYYEIFIDNEYPLIRVLSLNNSNARLEYSYLKETYLPIKVTINKEQKELKNILNIENIEQHLYKINSKEIWSGDNLEESESVVPLIREELLDKDIITQQKFMNQDLTYRNYDNGLSILLPPGEYSLSFKIPHTSWVEDKFQIKIDDENAELPGSPYIYFAFNSNKEYYCNILTNNKEGGSKYLITSHGGQYVYKHTFNIENEPVLLIIYVAGGVLGTSTTFKKWENYYNLIYLYDTKNSKYITLKNEESMHPEETLTSYSYLVGGNVKTRIKENYKNLINLLIKFRYVRIQKKFEQEVYLKNNQFYLVERSENIYIYPQPLEEYLNTVIYYTQTETGKQYYISNEQGDELQLINDIDNTYTIVHADGTITTQISSGLIIFEDEELKEVTDIGLGNGLYADVYYEVSGLEVQ